jgi:hypothetical protein
MGNVVAAFAAAWIIHFVYLVTIARRETRLRQALESLRAQIQSHQ